MRIKTFPNPLLMLALGLWDSSLSKSAAASPETNSPPPLTRAHAHNDYEHTRPLLDALDHGFCSIEADIWLVDGKLLVAHDRGKVKPDRTLQALYLDPMRERVRRNGGRVYPARPSPPLLVEVECDAPAKYAGVRGVLTQYRAMVTVLFGRS